MQNFELILVGCCMRTALFHKGNTARTQVPDSGAIK